MSSQSQFTGFCSYPHGGYVTTGLIFSTCTALTATMYAIASCRFAVLTFLSSEGNFEESFRPGYTPTLTTTNNDDGGGGSGGDDDATTTMASLEYSYHHGYGDGTRNLQATELKYRSSIGLFQWLRPVSDGEWTEGSCVGYQQSMLRDISEQTFETSRVFAVLAVVLATVVTLWSLLSACVAWNACQVALLVLLLLCGTVASGMTFLFLQSDICSASGDILQDSSCTLDEGGMVLVAGVILWLVALLIVAIFVRPPGWNTSTSAKQRHAEWRQKAMLDAQLHELRATAMRQRELNNKAKASRLQQKSGAGGDGIIKAPAGKNIGSSSKKKGSITPAPPGKSSKTNTNMMLSMSTAPSAVRSPNRKTPDAPSRTMSTLPSISASSNNHKSNKKATTPRTVGLASSSFDSYDTINSFQNRQRGKQFLQQEHQRQEQQLQSLPKQQQHGKTSKNSRNSHAHTIAHTPRPYRSRSAQPKARGGGNTGNTPAIGLVTHEPHTKPFSQVLSPIPTELRNNSRRPHPASAQSSPADILRRARSTPASSHQRQQEKHAQQQRNMLSAAVAAAADPAAPAAAVTMRRSSTARPAAKASSKVAASTPVPMTSRQSSSPAHTQQQQQKQQRRQRAGIASTTVDDISHHQELEVYLSEKMKHIDDLLLGMDNDSDDESDSDDKDKDNSKRRRLREEV